MKTCNVCHESKSTDCFYGARYKCIKCTNEERQKKKERYHAIAQTLIKNCNKCLKDKSGLEFAYDSDQCTSCVREKKRRSTHKPTPDMPDKICTKCALKKVATEFRYLTNTCKDCEKQDMYEWRQRNPDRFKEHLQKYRSTREYQVKRAIYLKTKYDTSHQFKVAQLCRTRIRSALKHNVKSDSTLKLMGVNDINFVINWLEFNFADGMTWENHGLYWHIDHIIPCAEYDLSKEDEQKRCFHWSNIAPLLKLENLSKGSKVVHSLVSYYEKRVSEYVCLINDVATSSN